MSDAITRLNAALEGRYAIERELGEGGMATVGSPEKRPAPERPKASFRMATKWEKHSVGRRTPSLDPARIPSMTPLA